MLARCCRSVKRTPKRGERRHDQGEGDQRPQRRGDEGRRPPGRLVADGDRLLAARRGYGTVAAVRSERRRWATGPLDPPIAVVAVEDDEVTGRSGGPEPDRMRVQTLVQDPGGPPWSGRPARRGRRDRRLQD